MRIKFYSLLGSILYSIYRAEDKVGHGEGKWKLQTVQKEVLMKGVKEGFLPNLQATFSPRIASLIIELIEIIVELLTAFGIFGRKVNTPHKGYEEEKE